MARRLLFRHTPGGKQHSRSLYLSPDSSLQIVMLTMPRNSHRWIPSVFAALSTLRPRAVLAARESLKRDEAGDDWAD